MSQRSSADSSLAFIHPLTMHFPTATITLSLALGLYSAPEAKAENEAGVDSEPIDVAAAVVIPESSDQYITFVFPGWLTGLEGTLGARGLETHLDAPFYDVYKNLDMLAAGSLEGRKGKFGIIIEGLYLDASFGGTPPGPLFSSASVSVEQVIAEAALTYRVFENDRAWLEILAGARYIYLGGELSLSVDSAGVKATSEYFAERIIDGTTNATNQEIEDRLPGLIAEIKSNASASAEELQVDLRGQIDSRAEELEAAARTQIDARVDELEAAARAQIEDRVDAITDSMRDRIDLRVGSSEPGYGSTIVESSPIRDVIRDYLTAKVEAEGEAARAEASAEVAELRSAARSKAVTAAEIALADARARAANKAAKAGAQARKKADQRLAKAEAKLAKVIEKEITDTISKSPVSASKEWVDPFVGLRGRCDIWEDWYLAARGDVGGFGVSSELTWNLYGALGYQITERTSLELGYRYLSVDYQSGDFIYDMAVKGPFVGVHIEF